MKRISILFIAATSLLALTSCDDYLDKVPDDRAEVNTVDKVAKLLVSAYAGNNSNLILEMSSDNARDNGSNYTPEELEQEEAYLWKDQTSTDNDAAQSVWDACYMAAAHANQALAAIDEMGNPAELNPYRGEALLCRAWAHFQLANVFCLAYNPQTADTDMGLPYSLAPETDVKPDYERGTMAELYKHISDDIDEGLPLIDDKVYTAPKYHFNKKAAYAFGARFNLFYQKWDKCIEYANAALGSNPVNLLRNWRHLANELAADYDSKKDETRIAWDVKELKDDGDYCYSIYRKAPGDKIFRFVTTVKKGEQTYADRLLKPGDTAEYFVKIVYKDGRRTKPSNTVQVKRGERLEVRGKR